MINNVAGSSHLSTKSWKGLQFCISLSNEEHDDTKNVQRARPMLFSNTGNKVDSQQEVVTSSLPVIERGARCNTGQNVSVG